MIGKLKGILDSVDKESLIIDVNGVGYIILCSSKVISNLPGLGAQVTLIIETQVREDSITLFGFNDVNERDWFRNLITVKGVGSKIALLILGALATDQVMMAIAARDKTAFTKISGIGTKIAERIITELKDKHVEPQIVINNSQTPKSEIIMDAVSALVNLGYNRTESYNIITKQYAKMNNADISELIKVSLKELSK